MPCHLLKATPSHVPGIVAVFKSGFHNMTSLFPATLTGDEWLRSSTHFSMTEPSQNTVYYIITDDISDDPEDVGKGQVLSFARWTIHPGGSPVPDWRDRWEKSFPSDMNPQQLGETFFDPMARQHHAVTGDRPHYFLEVFATLQGYQKRGHGSQLLKHAHDEADKVGWECYLDAVPSAKHLYESHGYVEQPDKKDPKSRAVPLLRPAKKL
ncbi:acyl-CoA N-acyltransferase [Xylogone sp. PMI_703]|nr:acyl-CoA N-acyltransferase [Xylogone sp. PMI_703]